MSNKVNRCAACGLAIKVGQYTRNTMLEPHMYYHRNCFKCADCSKTLWEVEYVIGSVPHVHCVKCKNDPSLTVEVELVEWLKVAAQDEAKHREEQALKALEEQLLAEEEELLAEEEKRLMKELGM